MVAAVTFDFWNTLVSTDPVAARARRSAVWSELFASTSTPLDPPVVDALIDRLAERFDASWRGGSLYGLDSAVADVVELVGCDPDLAPSLEAAWTAAARCTQVEAAPGAAEVLAELRRRRVPVGMVCDVGLTPSPMLRHYLDRLGLADLITACAFSDEVGCYKPDPLMFKTALGALGVEPHEAVHVGDLRRTDVAGARAMGMTAVRYRGLADDSAADLPDGHHVIVDHAELLPTLGLV